MEASYNKTKLAESSDTKVVEGKHYFPPDSLNREYFEESDHHTDSGWGGKANYLHIVVDDKRYENKAWYYPNPPEQAAHIKDHVAFAEDVTISV